MGINLWNRGKSPAASEATFNYERTDHCEFMHADSLIDRRAIELHATELIANQSQYANYIKNAEFYKSDARTALFEALRASGHLSVVESDRTSLEQIHQTMLGVLVGGWSDSLPEFEKRRRFQEICEELTIQEFERRVASGDLPQGMQLATVSDYVELASERQALLLGYRPHNKKGMVRSTKLIVHGDGTYTRVTEQVSRSNALAHETERFFEAKKLPTRKEQTADVRVLGTQFIYSEQDIYEGVVGLQRRLDAHKGADIRYGEVASDDQITYEELRAESSRRELEAECYVARLADYKQRIDQQLEMGSINAKQHNELLQQEILHILRAICTMRPEYAKDCFGEDSYKTYKTAAKMAASGDTAGASGHIERNSHLEQTVTLCGMSISAKEAEAKGVQPDDLATLLKYGMEKFKTKKGRCRVPECPSPKPTDVGPCDVCMVSCQPKFDKGLSFSKIVRINRVVKKAKAKPENKTFTFFAINKGAKREKMVA